MKHQHSTTATALLTELENQSDGGNKEYLFSNALHESMQYYKIKDPGDGRKILVKTARC